MEAALLLLCGALASADLFGNLVEIPEDPTIRLIPFSSYVGELSPIWEAKNKVDPDAEPRKRTRAAFDTAWEKLGRGLQPVQKKEEPVSSEDEEDPEPPKRPEEFVSEHEVPRDVPTRPKYSLPGGWAKGEMPNKKVDVGFVPLQIYSQTRRVDIEEHLPRERALEDAENQEELIAAPRLREVLKNTKKHEVYEEEGYEDMGYDHGGYNHHGEKTEDAIKNENTVFKKLPRNSIGVDGDARAADSIGIFSRIPKDQEKGRSRGRNQIQEDNSARLKVDHPKVGMGRIVVADEAPQRRSGPQSKAKKGMTIYVPDDDRLAERMDIAESRSAGFDNRVVNSRTARVAFPGQSSQRHYTSYIPPIVVVGDGQVQETVAVKRPRSFNVRNVASFLPTTHGGEHPTMAPVQFSASTPVQFASTINTYASLINQNFSSPFLQNPMPDYHDYDSVQPNDKDDYIWAQSNIHENRVTTVSTEKQHKIEEKKSTDATTTKSTVPIEVSTESQRKQTGRQGGRRRGSTRAPTTQDKNQQSDQLDDTTRPIVRNFTNPPKSLKMYSNLTRGNVKYNPEDDSQWTPTVGTPNIRHPSLPIDNGDKDAKAMPKTTMMPEHTQQTTRAPMLISIPSKDDTAQDPAANAKYVEQLTLAHFSVPANISPNKIHLSLQDERLKELAKQLNSPQNYEESEISRSKREAPDYDKSKYPHYESPPSISKESAVKYATNPEEIPKKTYGGMEFYESKENVKCSGPHEPNNITPERNEEGEWDEDPMVDGPRIRGVGNAIDCFKRKFFGIEPLDNPLFKEGQVEIEDDPKNFEESLPIKADPVDSGGRRIMVLGPNSSVEFKQAEPTPKPTLSPYTSRPYLDITFTTPLPLIHFTGQYQVYEVHEEQVPTQSPYKYKHYYSLLPGKTQYLTQPQKPLLYVPQSLSTYSILNQNSIPAVRNVAPTYERIPYSGPKDAIRSYNSGVYRGLPTGGYALRPAEYIERKVIVRKRETENSLWDLINPLKWWWPSLFDSRRHEPRYRRSAEDMEYPISESEEADEVGKEMLQMMASDKPTTIQPLTLSEFKSKFNISEAKKKAAAARLTGGFLNRNPDITDVMEILVGIGPTDSMESSTSAPSTTKPKVVFPRAKLPSLAKRKAFPPTKKPVAIIEHATTAGTTTTTTTTVPPPTTTRMYKPKRVIKKNFGRGPFDVFTILKNQQEAKATHPPPTEATSTEALKSQEEPRTLSSELAGENDTLTYMVNPATGVGSWMEQRKWKPKRKRPKAPSVYSLHRAKIAAAKKKQRDIPDPHQKVYVYGLMSQLLNSPPPEDRTSSEPVEERISRRSSSEEKNSAERPIPSQIPPPKFILDPDKRRYYYAKVR